MLFQVNTITVVGFGKQGWKKLCVYVGWCSLLLMQWDLCLGVCSASAKCNTIFSEKWQRGCCERSKCWSSRDQELVLSVLCYCFCSCCVYSWDGIGGRLDQLTDSLQVTCCIWISSMKFTLDCSCFWYQCFGLCVLENTCTLWHHEQILCFWTWKQR